jgi:hypothetical protein
MAASSILFRNPPLIYISHAPEDGALRDRIAAQFSDIGINVWEDSQTSLIQRFLPSTEPSAGSLSRFHSIDQPLLLGFRRNLQK